MGKHTRPQDRELGRVCLTYIGDEPSIWHLRAIVDNFDEAMRHLGLNPVKHEQSARLFRAPGRPGVFAQVGWHLEAGARD